MKKAINFTAYIFLLPGVLLLLGCVQSEKEARFENELNVSKPIIIENSDDQIFSKSKNQIIAFYDEIGYEIIDLILIKRVYEQNPEKRTKLENLPLDSFSNRLVKEDEKKVKLYTDTLVRFKNNLISSIKKNTVGSRFKEVNDSLLTSPFFLETLLAGKKHDTIYADLVNTIKRRQSEVEITIKNNLERINKEVHKKGRDFQNVDVIKKPKQIDEGQSISNFLINHKWWLFGLLIGSLLLNLFQYFLSRKKKSIPKRALPRKNEDKYNISYNDPLFQANPSTLNKSEIKKIIEQVYVQLRHSLSNIYHSDCVATISLKFDNLKSDTISEASSKFFRSEEELLRFLTSKIESHKSILSNELENCVPKEIAQQEIDKATASQNFMQRINTNIVSEKEILNKIQQFKTMVISELSNVILKPQLTNILGKLNNDITMALQKMVQDNLVYYFAFADTNGTLNDSKKTKTIERDSAIQLSVNPEDITKATFRLLLEKDDMMQAGIMSYDSFLIPICQLTSENFNSTGTKIEQIGPDGTMELENGIWKVKNKLPIKVI